MKNSISFCLLLIAFNICAQDTIEKNSVYKMRLGIDIPIGVLSLGTGAAGIALWAKKSPLTQAEINQFNILDVNQFDRYATYQHSKASAIVSDIFLYSAAASPALLFKAPLLNKTIP